MASLTHVHPPDNNPSSNPNSSLLNAPFNSNLTQMEISSHSSLPPTNNPSLSCFSNNMLSEFDGHLPFTKFQQDLPAAVWQPSGTNLNMHLLNAEKSMKSPASSFDFDGRMISGHIIEANSCVNNLQDMKAVSDLMSTPLAGESWGARLDQNLAYSVSMASMMPVSNGLFPSLMNTSRHGISEGTSVKELVGRLGGNIRGKGVSSLVCSSPTASTLPLGPGMEKTVNLGSNWNSMNATRCLSLTVDPSKGGLAIQGVNLTTSHCLANFSSDPAFAERAARFSCFGGQAYSELALPFPLTEGGKTYPRSAALPSDKPTTNKIARVPNLRNSAPNSPSAVAATEIQDPKCISDSFTGRPTMMDSSLGVAEEKKCTEKVPGRSTPVMQATEGAEKHGASVNDYDDVEGSVGQEASSGSEQGACEISALVFADNRKKRKSGCKDKCKDIPHAVATTNSGGKELKSCADLEECKGKRYRSGEVTKEREEGQKLDKVQAEQSNSGNSGESAPNSIKESSKPPEPPKQDYIHVRARRGQATDSHSLAERVRREKISERMKFLQDLVPGCSKVTGKAVMLDEIINYVQSLQRQVEFLSMKLAAVNPRLDFNIDTFVNKEMIQPRGVASSMLFAPENTRTYPHHQPSQIPLQVGGSSGVDVHTIGNPGDPTLGRTIGSPLAAMDAYGEVLSQLSQAWGDELQSIVQMGLGQGRQATLTSESLAGRLKVEL